MSFLPPVLPEDTQNRLTDRNVPDEVSRLANFPIEPSSENSIKKVDYILSNESGQEALLAALSEGQAPDNGIHLGFSGILNLDIIAARKSSGAILCDIDPGMIAVLDQMKILILSSNSKEDFQNSFWAWISSHEAFNQYLQIEDSEFLVDLAGFIAHTSKKGWLACDESFSYIKRLYSEEKILHRELNLTDRSTFTQIATWARDTGLVFDTLYDSNIVEWLYQKGTPTLEARTSNLQMLLNPSTIVISAWKQNEQLAKSLELKWSQGNVPKLQYEQTRRVEKRQKADSTPPKTTKSIIAPLSPDEDPIVQNLTKAFAELESPRQPKHLSHQKRPDSSDSKRPPSPEAKRSVKF